MSLWEVANLITGALGGRNLNSRFLRCHDLGGCYSKNIHHKTYESATETFVELLASLRGAPDVTWYS